MMRTRPERRTTLQCSHRTLTDGLTFISRPFKHLTRHFEPSHRSSRGRPGPFGTRPPLISSSRAISPLVSGTPGSLRHSAAPHLVFSSHLTARLGDARVPSALGRPSSRLLEPSHRSSRGRPGAFGTRPPLISHCYLKRYVIRPRVRS